MRKKPYTVIGIARLKCWRHECNNRAHHQWNICADGNQYRPICIPCDIEVNRMVLEFMGDPDADAKIQRYEALWAKV